MSAVEPILVPHVAVGPMHSSSSGTHLLQTAQKTDQEVPETEVCDKENDITVVRGSPLEEFDVWGSSGI